MQAVCLSGLSLLLWIVNDSEMDTFYIKKSFKLMPTEVYKQTGDAVYIRPADGWVEHIERNIWESKLTWISHILSHACSHLTSTDISVNITYRVTHSGLVKLNFMVWVEALKISYGAFLSRATERYNLHIFMHSSHTHAHCRLRHYIITEKLNKATWGL